MVRSLAVLSMMCGRWQFPSGRSRRGERPAPVADVVLTSSHDLETTGPNYSQRCREDGEQK